MRIVDTYWFKRIISRNEQERYKMIIKLVCSREEISNLRNLETKEILKSLLV
jgi:hypothetical protein